MVECLKVVYPKDEKGELLRGPCMDMDTVTEVTDDGLAWTLMGMEDPAPSKKKKEYEG